MCPAESDFVFIYRHSSSEFIVPYHKFSRSLVHSFSAGMTFKMRHETEDTAERLVHVSLFVSSKSNKYKASILFIYLSGTLGSYLGLVI